MPKTDPKSAKKTDPLCMFCLIIFLQQKCTCIKKIQVCHNNMKRKIMTRLDRKYRKSANPMPLIPESQATVQPYIQVGLLRSRSDTHIWNIFRLGGQGKIGGREGTSGADGAAMALLDSSISISSPRLRSSICHTFSVGRFHIKFSIGLYNISCLKRKLNCQ